MGTLRRLRGSIVGVLAFAGLWTVARLPRVHRHRLPRRERTSRLRRIVDLGQRLQRPEEQIEYLALCLNCGLRSRALSMKDAVCGKPTPLSIRFRLATIGGDIHAAAALVEEIKDDRSSPHRGSSEIPELIDTAIPAMPMQALTLICTSLPRHPARAALELAAGQISQGRQTLRRMGRQLGPDRLLLESNIGEPGKRIDLLNRYFSEHGLCSVSLRDPVKALSVNNLWAAPRHSPIQREVPLLSIVMTAYESSQYIGSCIDSVLRQTYPDIELIVVDDASTDDSADIAASFSSSPRRKIKLVRLATNVGTYAAKNIGIAEATGELVAFHDADDWSHPERFARCIDALDVDPNLVAVTCRYVRLQDSGQFVSAALWPLTRWTPNSLVFRREAVLRVIGYLDENRYGADSEYVARLKLALGDSRHGRLDLPLLLAAHHPGSLTNASATSTARRGHDDIRAAYEERWTEALLETVTQRGSFYRAAGQRERTAASKRQAVAEH